MCTEIRNVREKITINSGSTWICGIEQNPHNNNHSPSPSPSRQSHFVNVKYLY